MSRGEMAIVVLPFYIEEVRFILPFTRFVLYPPRVREQTYTWYVELLKSYVRPTFGDKKISDVRPLDVQALYTSLQEKGLSAKTVRHVHTTLSTALTQAVRWR